MIDINHLLRPGHLAQLAKILDDPEATDNDKFVAYDLLKNANIAAGGVLPMCQDTGTAIVVAKKGRRVWTEGDDEAAIAEGMREAYLKKNLRYSQVAPLSTFEETNTGDNLPAQIEIYAEGDDAYKFLFMAKGGGSANKTFLYQATPSILTHDRIIAFLKEKILTLGTAACPPYHLAIVIGGLRAELNLKTVKLASARYLDALPTTGAPDGRAFRDLALEAEICKLTQTLGVGAQFGGKYFCHDVRVIRLPRHGASLPIGLGVSCSADRQALGKITRDGVFLEELEHDPARFLPVVDEATLGGAGGENRPQPADDGHPRRTDANIRSAPASSLTGPMIVARDSAHAKIRERLERGEPMPDYFKNHPVYYAGPAKTPEGYASGSFGPTTAGRMDSFVDAVPGRGRLDGDARQGQPLGGGARGLRQARRLLSRLDRRPGGAARAGLHQQGRGARISRTRHGGDVADRGRELSGLHRHRRQGQRLLQGTEFGLRRLFGGEARKPSSLRADMVARGRYQRLGRLFLSLCNSQPRHCEEQSDEAIHAAACFLRKKSLRLLLATKGGWTTRGRDSGPAALDRFASLAMTALLATGLGVASLYRS